MTVLNSHRFEQLNQPVYYLPLAGHLAQVGQAARSIWARHSARLREHCAEAWRWVEDSVQLHDTGKASAAFQQYIADPANYPGTRLSKAHTPLSMACVLYHGEANYWDWKRRLAVAQIAAGHHSAFKTLDELERVVNTNDIQAVLGDQLRSLDWDALDTAVGVTIARLPVSAGKVCAKVLDELEELAEEGLGNCPDKLRYRMLCQLAYSVLLEADKAFLAVASADLQRYLTDQAPVLPSCTVDTFLAGKPSTPLDDIRRRAREEMLTGMARVEEGRLQTMTLPTGTGKTLLAATWALRLRERLACEGIPPRVLIVLPYLAIIDQTVKEYGDLLKGLTDPGDLLTYHSLAERELDTDLEDKSNDFFLDTWQSGVIITTFDQFLYALLSPKSRHQMRFHNLADALVVLDEVQTLPCKLWDPLDNALRGLTDLGTTHVLAMTATQPGFLASALELIRDRAGFFRQMRRYRLLLKHRQPLPLAAFIEECQRRLAQEWQGRRVLITLNTRRSARAVRDALDTIKRPEQPLYFLSADVTPRDRLAAIDKIKEGGPCLVVSTQCIEAGVDIDMDRVIRDFAPLDSLIQVAGRCNRNGRAERGTVEIVHLRDEDGRAFSSRIYDKVLLQETRTVLGQVSSVDEEDVLRLAEQYFALLREKKDTGTEVTKAWLDWQEFDPVRHLLRGKKPHQVSFVVIEQDPDLKGKLGRAFAVRDRWDRRREIRKLAAQVAAVTVNVWIPSGQNEDTFAGAHAEKLGWLWLLRSGLYRPGRGLDLEATEEDPGWGETIVM